MEIFKPTDDVTATGTLLGIRGLRLSFSKRIVLDGLDLDVGAPGVTAVMGPVAVGKTSLLHAASGRHLELPGIEVAGDIRYRGKPLGIWNRPYFLKLDPRLSSFTLEQLLAAIWPSSKAGSREVAAMLLEVNGLGALVPELDTPLLQLGTDKRRLAIVLRTLLDPEPLVCLDEPTLSLSDAAAATVLELIQRARSRKGILLVTHNQAHARAVADVVALLAGGRVLEYAPAAAFFANPSTSAGRQFVRTGSCSIASPGSDPRTLSSEYRREAGLGPFATGANGKRAAGPDGAAAPPSSDPSRLSLRFGRWHRAAVPASRGPEGFAWLIPGTIGGSPRPGIVRPLQHDLDALKRVRTTTLVSLLETDTTDLGLLARFGLDIVRCPIPDGEAPEMDEAMRLCDNIVRRLDRDETVVVYCRAGEGRTGTILAAFLVVCGLTAEEALAAARAAKPKWITTGAQERFVWDFEIHAGLASIKPET